MFKKAMGIMSALGLTVVMSSSAFATGQADFDTVTAKNHDSKELVVPLEALNKVAAEKGLKQLSLNEVATVESVNEALKDVVVQKDEQKTINLGHGQAIVISAPEVSSTNPSIGYNVTASGKIDYVFYGVQLFSLSESENYSYDGTTADIIFYANQPTVSAPGWVGWSTIIDNKYISNIDPKVKDAVADVRWTQTTMTRYGHMELRFTGAGNWFVHDSYIY
ncbi:hypothetical protein [Tumebacillus flagellatus]|uniref:Uncharacterized protein n=1 Tax=Tumebacillus flagellatus TaxID=1157490 RepID=A0A074M4G7_9BACL|nr:hypothetical protein [Tumebacillus flagellatus]KEO80902.1 hypothetical protein EL26_23795 [Tumebacillus flagellatus]